MKRVLEVFGEPVFYGGQETFVMDFIRHMDRTGLAFDMLTPYFCENEQFRKEFESWGGKIIEFEFDFEPGKSRSNIKQPLNKLLAKNKYDVVHVHSGSISVLAIVAACAKKNKVSKVIVHSHCGVEKKTIKNLIMRCVGHVWMKGHVDQFCACSVVAGEAKFLPHIVKNKMLVMDNGVDLKKYGFNPEVRAAMRAKLNISDDTVVLGHIGRFSYQKNHDLLIDIFQKYLELNSNSILLMLGDGELRKEIQKKLENNSLKDKVIMTGNVDNVNEYLQAFDIFVLPSRYEGLPIVGVEAQAAGLPSIVSTNVSDELKMIESFSYLPTDQGTEIWAKKIDEFSHLVRKDEAENIRKSGYDINITAERIRNMYL